MKAHFLLVALAMLLALPATLAAQQTDQYIILGDSLEREFKKISEAELGDFDRLQSFLRQKAAEERFVVSRIDKISSCRRRATPAAAGRIVEQCSAPSEIAEATSRGFLSTLRRPMHHL